MTPPESDTRARLPAVAGLFYPDDPYELRAVVRSYLDAAPAPAGVRPKALIVPHAGFVYSGPVAASAYRTLVGRAKSIERVVLAGPSHRMPVPGIALPSVVAFDTPLGRIPIDTGTVQRLLALPHVYASNLPHRMEHSLEVQLPFLQVVLGAFTLVPIVVGDTRPETVAAVIDCLWRGPETLLIVSSDLSHYLGYEQARRRDRGTCMAIEALAGSDIAHSEACGATPLRGLLIAAARRGLRAVTLDLRNSGDTAGGRDRVVGYGAWMFVEGEPCVAAA